MVRAINGGGGGRRILIGGIDNAVRDPSQISSGETLHPFRARRWRLAPFSPLGAMCGSYTWLVVVGGVREDRAAWHLPRRQRRGLGHGSADPGVDHMLMDECRAMLLFVKVEESTASLAWPMC